MKINYKQTMYNNVMTYVGRADIEIGKNKYIINTMNGKIRVKAEDTNKILWRGEKQTKSRNDFVYFAKKIEGQIYNKVKKGEEVNESSISL